MPEFQKDGQFDNEVYLNLLSRARLDPHSFSESIRQRLLQDNWAGALVESEFALPSSFSGGWFDATTA